MRSTSKTAEAPTEDRLDVVFHALSDRTRRSLLSRLAHGPAMVTELAKPFAMSLPAVSKHLRVLEAARLVVREVDGRIHRCSLSASPLRDVGCWVEDYRPFWEETLDALGRYVESSPPKGRSKRRSRR
jgi:DNA-binding transcriptional ArsR family regulator